VSYPPRKHLARVLPVLEQGNADISALYRWLCRTLEMNFPEHELPDLE
jgi:hypothetical protein